MISLTWIYSLNNYIVHFYPTTSFWGNVEALHISTIRAYLDYLTHILHKTPEDVSWDELRDYIRWLQKSRVLSVSDDTVCFLPEERSTG